MIKRLCFILMFATQVFCAVAQDEQKSIEITVNRNESVEVEFKACKIAVKATRNASSEISLVFNMKSNLKQRQSQILLFGRNYTKKELKKKRIYIDKHYLNKTNGDNNLLKCEGLNEDILQIEPSGNRVITLRGIEGGTKMYEFPLYIAQSKKPGKSTIMERVKIFLDVTISEERKPELEEERIDEQYDNIRQKSEDLIEEIANLSICPSKNHRPTKVQQKKPYLDRIAMLQDEISEIKSSHHWKENDEEYKKYKVLVDQLENVVFTERVCGTCSSISIGTGGGSNPPHHCSYCDMSPKDVNIQLQRIYQQLDNGKIKKNEAVSKMKSIQSAVGRCPNLKRKMNNDKSYQAKANSYYKSIANY